MATTRGRSRTRRGDSPAKQPKTVNVPKHPIRPQKFGFRAILVRSRRHFEPYYCCDN